MMAWIKKAVDVLALVYAVLLFPVPIFWLVIHPAIRFWRRFGSRCFWIAVPIWGLSTAVLVLVRHWIFAKWLGPNAWTASLGIALLLLGLWAGGRVHREFGLRRLVGLPEVNPERSTGGAVRTGIYALVRHPRYLGLMLTFAGFAFLSGAVGYFLLAILTILLYQIVAPLEERVLREQYGAQYEEYARAVPRYVPRLLRKSTPRTQT